LECENELKLKVDVEFVLTFGNCVLPTSTLNILDRNEDLFGLYTNLLYNWEIDFTLSGMDIVWFKIGLPSLYYNLLLLIKEDYLK
jgi:hypothetical protein